MLNYKIFANNKDITDKFAKYSKIYGTLFIILGAIGIIYPNIISLTSAIFIGWLMLLAGFFVAIQTWQINKKDWLGWLKALLYLVVGALTILNPVSGVIALAILFSIYFFMDSVINFALAFSIKPSGAWLITLLNGILSLALGVYFLYAIPNPIQAMWLVGIVIGISLVFDGIMLLSLANASKKN